MNYREYYNRESQKSHWQRTRGTNNRLSGKRESWKDMDIRANFEMEITKKANPTGWLFNAYLMGLSFSMMIIAFFIVILVEFQYAPMKSNTVILVNGLMFLATVGFFLTVGVWSIATRRRK